MRSPFLGPMSLTDFAYPWFFLFLAVIVALAALLAVRRRKAAAVARTMPANASQGRANAEIVDAGVCYDAPAKAMGAAWSEQTVDIESPAVAEPVDM